MIFLAVRRLQAMVLIFSSYWWSEASTHT